MPQRDLPIPDYDHLQVGSLIILDQLNDSNTDNGGIWVCGTGGMGICADEAQSGTGRSGPRQQQQIDKVVAISGTTVTLEDPIFMPNWRSSQSPQAWWSSDTPVTMSGFLRRSCSA